MNQEQLENLPYPMFKATDKHWLKTMRLIGKIETSMSFKNTLENWLTEFHIPTSSLYQFEEHGALVRDIWIRKLLAYSPE